jgi:hypothetical protein
MGQAIARQGFLIVLCFLLTPFVMAIHRFVLLGELPARYDFDLTRPRFQLLFGWLAVIALLAGIPSFLDALTAPKWPIYYRGGSFPDPGPATIVTLARGFVILMLQNLLVLFPAIAVEAPGAAWQNALGDTRRHVWFCLVVTYLPFIPVALIAAAVASLLRGSPPTLPGLIVNVLWLGVPLLVGVTLAAVIASRLYQTVGDRLNTPALDAR